MTDSRRFTPYTTRSAHPNLRWNAEGGPSAQLLPPIQHGTPPTVENTGESSETTADAENNKQITEDEEVSVSDCY